jgi:diguanylate cyclase (GGDEF)-like protein
MPSVIVFGQVITVPEKPVMIIGDDLNYPPYSYLDSKGMPAGFNVDLAKAVARVMGYDVEIRLDEWSKTRAALESGEIDAISGMFFSVQRQETYAFTSKHSVTNGDIFTRKDIQLDQIEALRDQTIVVQSGDIIGEYLGQLDLNINLVEVSTVNEALKLVADGTYDYAGVLKLPGLYSMKEQRLNGLRAQNMVLAPNDYCMAVRKDNETMLITLNSGLQILKATGEYDSIYDRWLGVYEEKTVQSVIEEYYWAIITILLIILLLLTISLILKRMVAVRTKKLNEMNIELEGKMTEIIRMEANVRAQYNLLIKSQAQLQDSEIRNRSIVQALPDIVFTLDDTGAFIACQASDEKIQTSLKSTYLGKYLNEVFPDQIASEVINKIRKAIDTQQLQTFEYELFIDEQRQIFEMRIVRNNEHEVIGITRNISTAKISRERIEFLSYHDQLTGLYNRRFFEAELLRLNGSENLPLCIMMADVNGLKLINDSFGHVMGDQLLKRVAAVLNEACGPDAVIARMGGDEFVILVPKSNSSQTELLVERIHKMSSREKVSSMELSISLGWEIKYTEKEDIHEVLKCAENKMYKNKLFEGPSIRGNAIHAIIKTLNEKNKREELHSHRVSYICKQLAIALNFSDQEIQEIESVGLLHDIGKIAIDEAILNKPGKLTDDEYEEIKRHPEIGYRILSTVNDMAEMAEVVLDHHERWDGKGYPRGLKGELIPIQSRMICIADSYDAITSDRSYRSKRSDEEAFAELRRNAGTQFDPHLVEPFIMLICSIDELNDGAY